MEHNSSLVYSTELGRVKAEKPTAQRPKGDGIVRIQRQTSGRKGKGVCLISGLDLDEKALQQLATELKKRCACGGAVKGFNIEIQGDNRELIKQILEQKGMKVKLSGG